MILLKFLTFFAIMAVIALISYLISLNNEIRTETKIVKFAYVFVIGLLIIIALLITFGAYHLMLGGVYGQF
jgi:hypothetical protein